MKKILSFLFFLLAVTQLTAQQSPAVVKQLKITVLSTMLAQTGFGEWGFSALIEADSVKILFDAGAHKLTVLDNSKELHVDLSRVPTLILSHSHEDHTTGWMPLRKAMSTLNKTALSVTHVAAGFFDSRMYPPDFTVVTHHEDSVSYIKSGAKIIIHKIFEEIFPGIFLTGPVPRIYPEKNYPAGAKRKDLAGNIIADSVQDDMSLVIRTAKGLVLVSGCGHSGIINTIEYIETHLQKEPLLAAIGGFHLFQNTDDQVKWTAEKLKSFGIRYFMGAHCTGIEPVYQIRQWAGLKRGECIVGSVGATFDLAKGFMAGPLTK